MRASRRLGFSLIELLVVIAIIAILAALVFPVFSRVKESSRQAQCLSNLHQLWVAARLYKDDQGVYPAALLGFAERPDGVNAVPGDPVVGADRLVHAFLMPKQVKDIGLFNCPDNRADKANVTIAHIPPRPTGWSGSWIGDALAGVCGTDSFGTIACWPDTKAPMLFYKWDSYDIGARIDPQTGRAVTDGGSPVYDLHYSKDWTGASGTQDMPNQLKYPSPPDDRTILAWCTWHSATASTGNVMAVTLGGAAKKIDVARMAQFGPDVFSR